MLWKVYWIKGCESYYSNKTQLSKNPIVGFTSILMKIQKNPRTLIGLKHQLVDSDRPGPLIHWKTGNCEQHCITTRYVFIKYKIQSVCCDV